MNSNNKNIKDLYGGNYFKRGYQPRNNLVKDETGDLLADSHNISNRWKNVSNVRHIEVQPLVPGPSHFGVEIATAS
jgi:hypothetical protein